MSSIPHHYCCPPPCCCTPTYTCESCASKGCDPCDTSAPPAEVSKGSWALVSDRNGNVKRLRRQPYSLLSSDASGDIMLRDGSLEDPIILGYLQTLLDGKGALVRNGQGVIGLATPTGEDQFFAYVGGVLQFTSTVPRTNSFKPEDFQPQVGRIATIGCEIDGMVTLGYLNIEDAEYLYADGGVIRGGKFCDAPPVVTLKTILGCGGDVLGALKPAVGMSVVSNIEGTGWIAGAVASGSLPIDRVNIYSKAYGVTAVNVTDTIDIKTLPGYDEKWKWIKLHFHYGAATSTTDFIQELSVNGRKYVGVSLIAGSFQGEENNNSADVPIPASKALVVTNTNKLIQPGSTSGQQNVNIWVDGWMT